MALVNPSIFETVNQLRDEMGRGNIRVLKAIILGVFVDGASIGDQVPRDVASKITYAVGILDSSARIDQSVLNAMTPADRPGINVRVVGPKRYTPVEIVIVSIGGTPKVHLFVRGTERIDLYGCNGKPVLEISP